MTSNHQTTNPNFSTNFSQFYVPVEKKKLGRNPRSDRDLGKKGDKSPKKKYKSKKEIKVLKRNKSPNRKGKIKVQTGKGNKSPNRKGK